MIINKYNNGGGGSSSSTTYAESAATSLRTELLEGQAAFPENPNDGDVVAIKEVVPTRGKKSASIETGVYQYSSADSDWNKLGLEGPQGPQGATGSQGPQGPQGADGQNGAQGAQGPQGADGQNGAQGPQGADGAQGPQGPQGPAGSGGSGDNTMLKSVSELPESADTGDVIAYAQTEDGVVVNGNFTHGSENTDWNIIDMNNTAGVEQVILMTYVDGDYNETFYFGIYWNSEYGWAVSRGSNENLSNNEVTLLSNIEGADSSEKVGVSTPYSSYEIFSIDNQDGTWSLVADSDLSSDNDINIIELEGSTSVSLRQYDGTNWNEFGNALTAVSALPLTAKLGDVVAFVGHKQFPIGQWAVQGLTEPPYICEWCDPYSAMTFTFDPTDTDVQAACASGVTIYELTGYENCGEYNENDDQNEWIGMPVSFILKYENGGWYLTCYTPSGCFYDETISLGNGGFSFGVRNEDWSHETYIESPVNGFINVHTDEAGNEYDVEGTFNNLATDSNISTAMYQYGLSGWSEFVGVQGAQGAQGAQGPQGATGARGAQGATGAQGPQGPQGPQGANGINQDPTKLRSVSALPESADTGDVVALAIVSGASELYWSDICLGMIMAYSDYPSNSKALHLGGFTFTSTPVLIGTYSDNMVTMYVWLQLIHDENEDTDYRALCVNSSLGDLVNDEYLSIYNLDETCGSIYEIEEGEYAGCYMIDDDEQACYQYFNIDQNEGRQLYVFLDHSTDILYFIPTHEECVEFCDDEEEEPVYDFVIDNFSDYYLDIVEFSAASATTIGVYQYDGSDWNAVGGGSGSGSTGPQGPQGPQGAQGATGPQGPQGPAGENPSGAVISLYVRNIVQITQSDYDALAASGLTASTTLYIIYTPSSGSPVQTGNTIIIESVPQLGEGYSVQIDVFSQDENQIPTYYVEYFFEQQWGEEPNETLTTSEGVSAVMSNGTFTVTGDIPSSGVKVTINANLDSDGFQCAFTQEQVNFATNPYTITFPTFGECEE